MQEETILNVAWETKKHREAKKKVDPIASRLSDKA